MSEENPSALLQNVLQQLSAQQPETAAAVTGRAGGGAVEVTLEGMERVSAVRISPEATQDATELGELVAAAINDALEQARSSRMAAAANLLGKLGVG